MTNRASIYQLATLMNARTKQKEKPYILILGTELTFPQNLDSQGKDAFFRSLNGLSSEEIYVMAMNLWGDMDRALYKDLASLILRGYFDTILTTSPGSELEEAMQKVGIRSIDTSVVILGRDLDIQHKLSSRNPRIKLIKLRGDLSSRYIENIQPSKALASCQSYERTIRPFLEQDLIAIGLGENDFDIHHYLNFSDNAIWFVSSGEPKVNGYLHIFSSTHNKAKQITINHKVHLFFNYLLKELQGNNPMQLPLEEKNIDREHEESLPLDQDTSPKKRYSISSDYISWPRRFDVGIQVIISSELNGILSQFNIDQDRDVRSFEGALFYFGSIATKRAGTKLSIVVHCQDRAGNEASASEAERIISRCRPRCMFLVGIAAGRRGKCKIGDVVVPRIVVDNTQGVAEDGKILPRVRTLEPPYSMVQQLKTYQMNVDEWYQSLYGMMQPPSPESKNEEDEYKQYVAQKPECHEAAIYSSDILLRDPNILEDQSTRVNQQIRAGEMEAAGFGSACNARSRAVPWYIVRGISDFGDLFKKDTFQKWAAQSAASYLRVLLENAIRIDLF
jgi:nucleoside phosphorylase